MSTMTLPPQLDLKSTDTRKSKGEEKLLEYLESLYQEGVRARDRWAPKSDRDRDLKLYRGDVGPKERDAFFKANFIQAFCDRMVQQLTDTRPTIRVDSRKLGLHKMAQVATKVAAAIWEESKMQRQTYKMAHNAAITRSAGLYTGYDPSTDEIVLETLKISQVVFDPAVAEASLSHRGEYRFIDRIKPVAELRQKFPGRGGFVKADATISLDPSDAGKRRINSPLDKLLGGGRLSEGDTLGRAHVREALIVDRQKHVDGKPMFPGGRLVFHTSDQILWDGPNIFWDGLDPVDWFDWIVDPEHPWGMSAPDLLMHLQLAFNQLGDGLVENHLLTNFISIIADHDALDPETWKKLQRITSSIILRKRNRNSQAPTVTPPPPFGADKIALARWLFTVAQLLTGVTDVTLGEAPGSLQSGTAIEGLVEGSNLGTRSRASRLEDFFASVGQKLLSRIFQFMPSDRVVSLVGPSGDAIEYAIKRAEFFVTEEGQPLSPDERREALRWHRFIVQPGSSMPGTRLHRGQLMKDLVLIGAASRKRLLAAADFPNPEEMVKEAFDEFKEYQSAGFVPPAAAKK